MPDDEGMSFLLSADELHALLRQNQPVVLLDVRWRLDQPDGRPAYVDGHVPGAVYVDLHHELSRSGASDEGRHPLPSTAALQSAARRWGVNDGDIVVAYDDAKGLPAARAWWLLRRAGVDVRVLDGGLNAWTSAGYALETGDVAAEEGALTLVDSRAGDITIDEAEALPERGVLLDVRAAERYRGDVEPLDPIAGHIPGAINLPVVELQSGDGTLRDPEELRARFADAGVEAATPVAAYCGSGVTAAYAALALSEAGIEPLVFTGSWSQWSNTVGRPVAVGAAPAGVTSS